MLGDLLQHGWISVEQVLNDTQIHCMYNDLLFHLLDVSSQESPDPEDAVGASAPPTSSVGIPASSSRASASEASASGASRASVSGASASSSESCVASSVSSVTFVFASLANVPIPQMGFDEPTCVICMEDLTYPAWTDGCFHRECCEACLRIALIVWSLVKCVYKNEIPIQKILYSQ